MGIDEGAPAEPTDKQWDGGAKHTKGLSEEGGEEDDRVVEG